MKLVPLADRVVLKQLEAEQTTKSGIVLPGQEKEKPQQAEVIAVGPGGVVDARWKSRLATRSSIPSMREQKSSSRKRSSSSSSRAIFLL